MVLTAAMLGMLLVGPQAAQAPRFDAASVKAVAAGDRSEPARMQFTPGRLTATHQTLEHLVAAAYSMPLYQVGGGPDWVRSELFDVHAEASGAPPVEAMRRMLQALLAERFQLRVKQTERQGRVYWLEVDKGGAKLASYKDDGTIPPFPNLKGVAAPPRIMTYKKFTYPDSGNGVMMAMLRGHQATAADLAHTLAGIMKAPVEDHTGITAAYDFGLKYAPSDLSLAQSGRTETPEVGLPDVFAALREQLGLRLAAEKGPVPYLAIVAAVRPGVN